MSIYLQFTHLIIQLMTISISNCGLKITYIYLLRMDFLSIGFCEQTNKQRMMLQRNMGRKKGSIRIEMIIKMVNKFKLTVVYFSHPNLMQLYARTWIYCWPQNCGTSGLGHGPPGHRRPQGARLSRAAGPLGGCGPCHGPAFSKTPSFKLLNFYALAPLFCKSQDYNYNHRSIYSHILALVC